MCPPGEVVADSKGLCHAYGRMSNPYHRVLGTPEGSLSKGVCQLNGVNSQAYNRRHRQVRYLLEGRYKAILVEAERYLLELARHVMLNPVRAGVVSEPDGWAWSSYNATPGEAVALPWLAVDALLGHFAAERSLARRRYRRFAPEGAGQGSISKKLNRQTCLDDARFVEPMRAQMESRADVINIPKVQRRAPGAALGQSEAAEQSRGGGGGVCDGRVE